MIWNAYKYKLVSYKLVEILRTETFRKERERFKEFISSNDGGYLKMTMQREKDVTLVSHRCARKIARWQQSRGR